MVNRFAAVANIGAAAMAAFILHGCGKEKEEPEPPTEEEINKANGDDTDTAVKHGKKVHTRAEEGGDKKKGKKDNRGVDVEDDENRDGANGYPCDTDEDCTKVSNAHFCDKSTEEPQCMLRHTNSKMTHEEAVKAGEERLAASQGKENWKEENQDTQTLQKEKAEGTSELAFKGGDEYKKNTAGVTGQITAVTPSGGKKKS